MIGTPAADMMCLDVLKWREVIEASWWRLVKTRECNCYIAYACVLPFDAHVSDGRGRRPDEDDAFLFTRLCKLCVF